MNPRIVLCVAILGALLAPAGGARAAEAPARNVAPLATITASAASEGSAAGAVADGKVPAAGSRDDNGQVWLVKGSSVPATLTFTWKEPVPVAAVVYYERTTWGFEYFREHEITVDDAAEPVAKGTFRKGHGPQVVTLPHPVVARKLALRFLSFEGGNPGAAEVQIFTAPPPPSALLCRFSTFDMDFRYAYYHKMLETFADGIYWDNFFLQPCYVPAEAGGPGYVDDDGKLRPGVNLMAFRSLVRRNAVMMYRMGKRPLTYLHMTNTNVVPMLSFGTLDLDWEWRDQGEQAKQDLQDRLGADQDTGLILAQSLGLKAGNISVAIDRFTPPANSGVTRDWLFRTVMAVCLPHEIKVYQGTQEVSFVQEQLAAFGYGRPECKVYRYWEDGFPLAAEGANTHALVLSRGAKALLAIGNYGPERQQGQPAPAQKEYTVTLKLDLKTLGLPDGARAFNVEKNRAELARTAPGVFTLPIRHHDFALVAVE